MSQAVPPDLAYLQWLLDIGYMHPRPLPGGRYGCIIRMAYTHAVVVGQIGDQIGYDDRWCYATCEAAVAALAAWDGNGEPRGWIRHPASGRRVSQSPDEYGPSGRVGAVGVEYVAL